MSCLGTSLPWPVAASGGQRLRFILAKAKAKAGESHKFQMFAVEKSDGVQMYDSIR